MAPAAPDPNAARSSSALWLLRVLLALCLLIPALIFTLFAAYRWQAAHDEATARVERTLAVAYEHALKVLDNNETLLGRVLELVGTEDDDDLLARQAQLHEQLAEMARDRLQIQSIWVWGPDGHPLAGNRFLPLPRTLDVSDREFFRHHQAGRGGLYFTEPLVGKATHDPFFDMSIGRYRRDGSFAGLVSVGMFPSYFQHFHSDLIGTDPGTVLVMFRADGVIYARAPDQRDMPQRLGINSALLKRVGQADRAAPFVMTSPFVVTSTIDGVTRIVSYRKIGKYPLYVAAGVDLAAVRHAWLKEMGILGALTVFPMAGLLFAAVLASRRTAQALDAARQLQRETSARQQAEQALFQSKKLEAVGRLAGGIAHDFNNALMVVAGNLFILKRQLGNEHARSIDAISRAVESANKLTKQLLAFSRPNALAPEILRLQERLPAVEPLLAPVLGAGITLSVSVADNTLPVRADPAELELTLVNLALNARDAIASSGRLQVRASTWAMSGHPTRPGPWVVIEVEDDGDGIEPKVLERIFDPFFTTKQVGKGTGLGLSQVYAFCQHCGGWAEADSVLGQGTTIRLFLAPAQVAPAGTEAPARNAASARVQARVLLVDDNPEIAAVLEETLLALGCAVVCHESADDAVRWLDANGPPDVVLTDVVMPGRLDGLDLARVVRQRYSGVPVILMTGYSDRMDEATALGVTVLPKPFGPQALVAAMAALNIRTDIA